tara:strand:+ start:432 stop:776 length:345 start_codon:yes stop_codon:yes gene_type:complete
MKKSPLNHCSSDMMHSEAWNTMRKRSVVGKKSALSMLGIKSKPTQDIPTVQADQTDSGLPWSVYSDADIDANKGSGKPLPTQYFKGQKVMPNKNDAFQTPEQSQATEDLENSNN